MTILISIPSQAGHWKIAITVPEILPDIKDLLARLQDKDRKERYQALCDTELYNQSTSNFDVNLFDCLISILRDEDIEMKCKAVEVLAQVNNIEAPSPLLFKALTNLLARDIEPDPRKAVVEILGGLGEQAIPILIDALNDQDDDVREAVVASLSLYDSEQALDAIISAFHCQNDLAVKLLMLEGLARSRNICWLPLLAIALDNDTLRYTALDAIAFNYSLNDSLEDAAENQQGQGNFQSTLNHVSRSTGWQIGFSISSLIHTLTTILSNDPNPAIRELAASCFSYCEHGLNALTLALHDSDADVREKAAYSLGTIGNTKSVEPLRALYQREQNQKVQLSILSALGNISDKRVLPILISAMDDSDAEIRWEAVSSIGLSREAGAIPALCLALTDSEINIRLEASRALGRLATSENDNVSEMLRESVVAALCIALNDAEEDVRVESAAALGEIQSKNATPALLSLLHDVSENVRIEAMKALSTMKNMNCLAFLLEALNNNNIEIQKAAAASLIHFCDQDIQSNLLTYLGKPKDCAFAKADIIDVVSQIGDKSAVPALIDILQNDEWDLREKAAQGLAHIPTQAGIEALIIGLTDEDSEVSNACIRSLAMIGDERAIPPLEDLLNDNRAEIRRRVLLSLASFRNYDTTKLLERFLEDPDEIVRQTALLVIEELENGGMLDFYGWGNTAYE